MLIKECIKDLFLGLGVKGTKFWFEARNSEESTIVDNAFGGEGGFQWGGVARAFLDKRDNIFTLTKGCIFLILSTTTEKLRT